MPSIALESGAELLALLGSALGTAVLTAAGLLVEEAGLQNVLAGQTVLGVWEAGIGAVLLFAGVYLLCYEQSWRRLRALRRPN